MSHFKDLITEIETEAMLAGMLNQEIHFQLERLQGQLTEKIDRCLYYDEKPDVEFLRQIQDELKQIRERYS